MTIEIRERKREHVSIYWNKSQDEEIKKMLPSTISSEEQALVMFEKSLLPDATSYGKVIYLDGEYIGDIWCYGINEEKEKLAMLSYVIFEKDAWGRGVATTAVGLFLEEIFIRFRIEKVGAFTYSNNHPSIKVLEKQGFCMIEEFEENAIYSKYFEKTKVQY